MGLGILLVIVTGSLIPEWRANNRYVSSTCEVLDKRLGSQAIEDPKTRKPVESFRPEIHVRYDVKGRTIETWAYDATGGYSPDRSTQQAIVDSFQVGASCPVWYDPDRPDKAVLVRGQSLGLYFSLIIPLGLMAVGACGILLAWKMASAPSVQVTPGGEPVTPVWVRGLQALAARSPGAFDPAVIGDPVAMKTDWTPVTGTSASFQTQKLVEVDPDRRSFAASFRRWVRSRLSPG